MSKQVDRDLLRIVSARLVSAYVSKNPLPGDQLAELIEIVQKTLTKLTTVVVRRPPPKPFVPVKQSIHDDFLVCLEDGKKFKTLKRHLSEIHGLTALEYRRKWDLPVDYPMIAPNYRAARSAFSRAKRLGFKRETPVVGAQGARAKVNKAE